MWFMLILILCHFNLSQRAFSFVNSILIYKISQLYVSLVSSLEIERRIQALEMRCYRRLLNISYEDHVTNEEVRNRIQRLECMGDLLNMVKKQKLRWYGHISRSSGMAKTILQGTVTVKGKRRMGRQKK